MKPAGWLLLVGAGLACALGWSHGTVSQQRETIAGLTEEVTDLVGEMERDDAIFLLVFGGQWDRSKPLLSTAVEVTCYTSDPQETDDTPYITADGSTVRVGIIAVSRDLLSEVGLRYGQRIILAGYGVFEVRDTMNARWRRRVDIWLTDKDAALKHGIQTTTLLWQAGV